MPADAAEIVRVAEPEHCWVCHSEVNRMARSIMHRLGKEPSMKELWARLEQAEADRDRMMNALQEVEHRGRQGKITMDARTRTIIGRALSRIKPHRPAQHDHEVG